MRKRSDSTKNRIGVPKNIQSHYVYAHIKQNGEIFYIGKGRFLRAWSVSKRRAVWYSVTENQPWKVVILADGLTNTQSEALELEVIVHFAKFNKLVNHKGIVKWIKI